MRAKLIIDVDYDAATTTNEYVKAQLGEAAEYLVSIGMLTGDGPAVVDGWNYKVEVKDNEQ